MFRTGKTGNYFYFIELNKSYLSLPGTPAKTGTHGQPSVQIRVPKYPSWNPIRYIGYCRKLFCDRPARL